MPNKDGSGPIGQGANAGRGAGHCAGPDGAGRRGGRGFGGRRRGRGRSAMGPRPGLDAGQDPSWLRNQLNNQLNRLQAAIHRLTARLNALHTQ